MLCPFNKFDDWERALRHLEGAREERNVYALLINYDPLPGDTRFKDVTRRLGLPSADE